MNWEDYKLLAQTSRDLIVFPFFATCLQDKSGVWIDVGCGTGDLTCDLSNSLEIQIVGIDKNLSERTQADCSAQAVHLVKADLTKNGIIETGLVFDGAYSNCCFCHLNDQEFVEVLVDLHSSLRVGAELIFLVPSFEWARDMYSDVVHENSGITAVPRYGERQHFRLSAWYESALENCGFVAIKSEQVLIPGNAQLHSRYLDKAGSPLFTAFRATRAERLAGAAAIQKAFDIAHENRKLEIQLFWQRSLFFWGFVAAALVGYIGTFKEDSPLTMVFAVFGLICSVVWSQGNRGSKYWQEYWEKKVNFLQHHSTGNIFYDRRPTTPKFWDVFEGRRISVSKLTMALSDSSVFLWFTLCLFSVIDPMLIFAHQSMLSVGLFLAALVYCLFFLRHAKSED